MDEPYLPKSDFIWMAANDEIPLTGSEQADHNLRLLIALMRDPDVSNRDWATMTLAMQDLDTPDVREALLASADDVDVIVRAEALEGLAQRDKELALPLVEQELLRDECGYGTFRAAEIIGHRSLLPGLCQWRGRTGASWIDNTVEEAIRACEAVPT